MTLELKVLPLMVVAIISLFIILTSLILPTVSVFPLLRYGMAFCIVIAGLAMVLTGALSFRAKATTVNPLSPKSTSSLVTTGIYRFSRNPMH